MYLTQRFDKKKIYHWLRYKKNKIKNTLFFRLDFISKYFEDIHIKEKWRNTWIMKIIAR